MPRDMPSDMTQERASYLRQQWNEARHYYHPEEDGPLFKWAEPIEQPAALMTIPNSVTMSELKVLEFEAIRRRQGDVKFYEIFCEGIRVGTLR